MIDGTEQLTRRLEAIARRTPGVIARGLEAEARIQADEMTERTPVLTGRLRASLRIGDVEHSGDVSELVTTMGGPGVPYARVQHEADRFEHPRGQSQFMRSVVRDSERVMLRRLGRHIHVRALG